jgi:hypothetical protein
MRNLSFQMIPDLEVEEKKEGCKSSWQQKCEGLEGRLDC